MNRLIPSEKVLKDMYLNKKYPIHKISKELQMSVGKVYKYLKLYEIPTRNKKETFTMRGHKLNEQQRQRISKMNKGKILSDKTKEKISLSKTKKGIGHKKNRSDGYIAIYFPDHPKSNKDGYIMEHDLVMECFIGRHLKEEEIVHHINHKRNDNRIENLKLMTKSEHMSMHAKERQEQRRRLLSTE